MADETWKPLLEGELADQAARTVDEIAAALPGFPAGTPWIYHNRISGALALSNGRAGQALFWAYLALAREDERAADAAMECLGEAVEDLPGAPLYPSLYSGYVGTAWVTEHLRQRLGADDEDEEGDPNQEIDEVLLTALDRPLWTGDFDLISGLVGFGVYALERLPRPSAAQILDLVVWHLADSAVEKDGGIAWFTPESRLPPDQKKEFPDGYFNTGVAHGSPGVVALLAAACQAGVAADKARSLLDGAVAWLLDTRLAPGEKSRFPTLVAEGREPIPSRIAWCHGDPGVALALLYAARCVGNADWEAAALEAGLSAARRPVPDAGVEDSSLCHGSAGLGHLFNRLFQASGDETFAEAARFWFRYALETSRTREGVTGFLTYGGDEGGNVILREEGGFLTGIAGVGLALLGATTAVAPDWDRALLTAVPPCA